MTEENYNDRTNPLFLRNQFKGKGKLQIPVIPKFQIQSDDFHDLLLIGFDKIGSNDKSILTAWFISFCMITNLNAYGKIRILI